MDFTMLREPLLVAAGVLAGLLLGLWVAGRKSGETEALLANADRLCRTLSDERDQARETAEEERTARQAADIDAALAVQQASLLRQSLDEARTEAANQRLAAEAADQARTTAEREAALARLETETVRQQMADWEKTRGEFLKTTQASVLATAQEISTKLLADHKAETKAAKEAAEAKIAETTAALRDDVKSVTDGVSQLKGQVAKEAKVLETVTRALSNPAGAGYFAEIGLANTLTSFGLVKDRDFVLQATTETQDQGRRRPDALVFLPGDGLLVIDCKASKAFLQLAEAEGTDDEAAAYQALAKTMNQHLKDLQNRDYARAIADASRRKGEAPRILLVMYLPNEAALEKLGRADPGFVVAATKAKIIPAGPAGLASIIGFAAIEIGLQRQIENQESIGAAAERLLASLAVALGHAAGVGKGIKGAADAFQKFSASLNIRVLPRARDLVSLGVPRPKDMPGNLPLYQVVDAASETIEGEAADAIPQPMIEHPVRPVPSAAELPA